MIETDHKPLENILYKDLAKTSPRLQRLKLRLQPYDVTIRYRPGKEMFFPDMLSTLGSVEGTEVNLDKTTHHMLTFSDGREKELQLESSKEAELIALARVAKEGWPNTAQDHPKCIRTYFFMYRPNHS